MAYRGFLAIVSCSETIPVSFQHEKGRIAIMSDKALSNAELELTQRIQMHFPRGAIPSEVLMRWNGCSVEILTARLAQVFKEIPVSPAPQPLLELVSTIMIPAMTGKFVAKEKFVRDISRKAKVKVSYLGDNFTAWFLSGDGKIEDPITEQTLRYQKLRQSSVDGPIIIELGGEAKAETALSEMFSLMEKQKNGEDGVLLNNGYANIFYIKDNAGVLRTVYVFWYDDGWDVNANSIEYPSTWHSGRRVFSCNFMLSSSATVAA